MMTTCTDCGQPVTLRRRIAAWIAEWECSSLPDRVPALMTGRSLVAAAAAVGGERLTGAAGGLRQALASDNEEGDGETSAR